MPQSIFKSIATHEQYVCCAGLNKEQDSGTQCLVTTSSACIIFSQNPDNQFFPHNTDDTEERITVTDFVRESQRTSWAR